uniref:Uncharacterized protein n=1 Tax=Ulva intestinalis TaxID=3116 RepID=A0A8K1HSW0_ULVIN|nr:hypothetical protein LK039_mgp36 [Ulva intestinalis]UBR43425.1 hypothetical protein [Ulva intestinalis]
MGSKFKAYCLWEKAFNQVEIKAHLSDQGLKSIAKLKAELSSVKRSV